MAAAKRVTVQDIGLAVIRLGIGVMFFLFGLGKILAGRDKLIGVGSAMEKIGLPMGDAYYWGLAAALTELLGGVLLAVGVFFRPACTALLVVMVVAVAMLVSGGAGMIKWSHAFDMAVVFAGLAWIGPGRLSLKAAVPSLAKRWYA